MPKMMGDIDCKKWTFAIGVFFADGEQRFTDLSASHTLHVINFDLSSFLGEIGMF